VSIAETLAADYVEYMKYAGNLYLRLCLLRNDVDGKRAEIAGVQAYEPFYDDKGSREFRVGVAECERIPEPPKPA
jgi:hypothetical protein